MTDDTPIGIATFEQLWDEIERRAVGALLVIETKDECDTDETETKVYYSGGVNSAVGMSKRAEILIAAEIIEGHKRKDDDDD